MMENNLRLNPTGYFRMPFIMGSLWKGENPQFIYPQTEVIVLQYLTDNDAINSLLPSCFKNGEEPLVTVIFGYYNGLDFMAGGGYNIAAVQVSARFDGKQDHLEGDYTLVMFENETWPIIGGREDLGVPKLYADISPFKILTNGSLRCEASLWGHLLFGLELSSPKEQNRIVRLAANKIINSRFWLAYKYIPSLDGPPDADYPTLTKNDTKIKELWFAKSGELFFGNAEINDIGQFKYLIDALKTLKVKEVKRALHFRGNAILRYDLSRRLK
jgi:acetoacetate decarboxylase